MLPQVSVAGCVGYSFKSSRATIFISLSGGDVEVILPNPFELVDILQLGVFYIPNDALLSRQLGDFGVRLYLSGGDAFNDLAPH